MTNLRYTTYAQRNRMMRTALAAVLMTKKGSSMTTAQIARRMGCDARTVASVKSDLQQLGLLAAFSNSPLFASIPTSTYDDLATRLNEVCGFFRILRSNGIETTQHSAALQEANELRRIIEREGSLPRFQQEVTGRLAALEELAQAHDNAIFDN